MTPPDKQEKIIHFNVGGQLFSTSRSTLTWVKDTFFTSLLSGRIATVEDERGAKFIDRDPEYFRYILNYLRTKQIDTTGVNLSMLKHEAQFYNITPLVGRLTVLEELSNPACGGEHYQGCLLPPPLPLTEEPAPKRPTVRESPNRDGASTSTVVNRLLPAKIHDNFNRSASSSSSLSSDSSRRDCANDSSRGNVRKNGYELTKQVKSELCNKLKEVSVNDDNPFRVRVVRAHNNSVAVAYSNFVACYKMRENADWQLYYTSPRMPSTVSHISLITKFSNQTEKLAVALIDSSVHLWSFDEPNDDPRDIVVQKLGTFFLGVHIDKMFFIGSQLVALSKSGKVGIWYSVTQNWQVQDMMPISCYDTAGSILLLGCTNGSIYYFDMQKFPLRMKDNDLLITELYKDQNAETITAISVYLTPKTNLCGNWIEIAYGTSSGTVRVIAQHPETVGHGPQLFQTYTVHTSPITRVALTTNYLISVCSEYNHVRSWSVTRFRGMINTQPGGTSLASFKVLTLDAVDDALKCEGCDPGPFGDQDTEQLFIQRLVPDANTLFIRLASTGDRICTVRSIDASPITAFYAHECEVPNRMGARPKRYLFTGTVEGAVQMWDLSSAIDQHNQRIQALSFFSTPGSVNAADKPSSSASAPTPQSLAANSGMLNWMRSQASGRPMQLLQGPTPEELFQLIDGCDLCCASLSASPSLTPQPSSAYLANLDKAGRCT